MSNYNTTMTKSSRKRLQKDIIQIIKEPLIEHGIHYAHDENNFLNGYAVVFGPSDTIYRHGCYCFKLKFPTNYPFSPPKLTYMTNDGETRFHPNLYRNGKVCISILNTWKGEQWTSCQSIKSVLLMLVTLFHNKPLLNEPGIKETNSMFIPYNKIITYKNLEIALLRNIDKEKQKNYMDKCQAFIPIYENYIKKNHKIILNYVNDLKNNQEDSNEYVRLYNMRANINYSELYDKIESQIHKLIKL